MNYQGLTLFFALASLIINGLTQERCAHQACMERAFGRYPQHRICLDSLEKQARASLNRPTGQIQGVITIPVVVHVVYKTAAENLSDARIAEQLAVLNEDFRATNPEIASLPPVWRPLAADAQLVFCLARQTPDGQPTTGIHRVQTQTGLFTYDDQVKYAATGGVDAWDTQHYLNIWVCNMGGLVFGYTPSPGGDPAEDGVVLDYRAVGVTGTTAPTNKGRTATHEIGHWLNLRHIWGDDAGCDSSDFVADTPNQASSTSGCPAFPKTDACASASPGAMFQNFMDYTHDNCMALFTHGQVARMRALFDPANGIRREMLASKGCETPTNVPHPIQQSVRVWPQPGRGKVWVAIPEAQLMKNVVVIGFDGKIIESTSFSYAQTSSNTIELNIENIANGIYLIKINMIDGRNMAARIVVGESE